MLMSVCRYDAQWEEQLRSANEELALLNKVRFDARNVCFPPLKPQPLKPLPPP